MVIQDGAKAIVAGFLEWCKSSGCSWHENLNLEYVEGSGAGAKASKDIAKGDVLLSVPTELCICNEVTAGSSSTNATTSVSAWSWGAGWELMRVS